MVDIAVPNFIVRPVGKVTAGAVVIHEGNGLGTPVLRFAQRLAREGYMVACPDLFFRVGGTEAGPYQQLMPTLKPEEVEADLVGTAEMLRSQGADVVAVTGFCLGGSLSYRMAVTTDAFDVAVGFYGSSAPKELGDPRCPMLMMYGLQDPWISREDIDRFVERHPDSTILYPDAGHGFMRDGTEDYREAAAADGWQQMLAFFSEHLARERRKA